METITCKISTGNGTQCMLEQEHVVNRYYVTSHIGESTEDS